MVVTPPPQVDNTGGMERTRGSWLIWAAVAVGLLLRGYHYARGPAVWHDEAALLVNVLKLPLADSLGPLLHDEASPPLFLWLEKAVAVLLGDGEYALRLPSFLAACLAILFTAFAARRLLPPLWAAVAVGLVAVSDRLLFHACEAKWYSVDVCVAAGAIWAVVATANRPVWVRSLVGAIVAPACIWISFPACFVFGGVLTGLLPAAWRHDWRGKAAFAAFALSVGVSFVLLAVGPAKAQRTKDMSACWTVGQDFADWNDPTRVPVWAVANSFDVARYAFHPFGWPLLVPAVVGAWSFLRTPGGWAIACVTLLPMGLVFVAACLGKYPYSAARTVAFLTPGLALQAGEGLRRFWGWCRTPALRWGFLLLWVPVLLIPAGYTARRVVDPWERPECDRAAAYVLSHRETDEPINANHWEYEYYFRRVDEHLVRVEHNPDEPKVKWMEWVSRWETPSNPPRIWYIYQSNDELPKVPPDPLPAGYRCGEAVTFGGVRVWELVPEK